MNHNLQSTPGSLGNLRRLTVAKSASAPVVSFQYVIGPAGLQLEEDDVVGGGKNFWEQDIGTRRS